MEVINVINEIFQEKFQRIKNFIFNNGRLIDRIYFSFFFEKGCRESCIKALKAYQNLDGGFGNGIEPDLLCPESNAIGAETALYYLNLLDIKEREILEKLETWVSKSLNSKAYIDHPFDQLFKYPHQKWWENSDDERILSIAGLFKKFNLQNEEFFNKIKTYYDKLEEIKNLTFYDYPKFIYLNNVEKGKQEAATYRRIIEMFPNLQSENESHYPIWSRYWYHIIPKLDKEILDKTALKFIKDIDQEGGIPNPYKDLPWWKPIFTLDGLILLKKNNYID